MSITDELTGVYNRRHLYEYLESEFERAKRYKLNIGCIFFDIDFFKKLNDTYGHQAGDLALKQCTSIVRDNLRTVDFFARYGGEEFICIISQTNLQNTQIVAEKLRNAVEKTIINLDPFVESLKAIEHLIEKATIERRKKPFYKL